MARCSQYPVKIMETQTRFDLNAAMETWRSELAALPHLTAENRRELETHLADTIAGLRHQGLNEEESFWLACRRIGRPQAIGEEFEKADPSRIWRDRILWMLRGSIFFSLIISSIRSMIGLSFGFLNFAPRSPGIVGFIVSGPIYLLPVLALAVWLAKGKCPKTIERWLSRLASPVLLLAVVISWSLFNEGLLLLSFFSQVHGIPSNAGWWQGFLNAGIFSLTYNLLLAFLVILLTSKKISHPKQLA